MTGTTNCDTAGFQQPLNSAQSFRQISMVPTVETAQSGIGSKGQIAEDEQRSYLQRNTARRMTGSVKDVDMLVSAERQPLTIPFASVRHEHRLGMKLGEVVAHRRWRQILRRAEKFAVKSRAANLGQPRIQIRDGQVAIATLKRIGAGMNESDAPKSWQDLLTPKWKDKVTTAGPESGPTFGWIVYISHKYGWDYFDKLHANNPIVAPSSDETVALLATGERPVAIVNCFDILEAGAQGSPIGNIFPKDGLAAWWAGMAIPKAAPHPNAAEVLANFVMSAEGAAAASKGRHGYVAYLNKDTPMAKVLPPIQELVKGYPKIDWATLDPAQVTKDFRKRMGQ